MSENVALTETVPFKPEVQFPFTEESLSELLKSSEWQELTPFYPRIDHLFPSELTFEQLKLLIVVITQKLDLPEDNGWIRPTPKFSIDNLGELLSIGEGEVKHGYCLLTNTGKKLAVVIQHGYNLDLKIPDDPHLFANKKYLGNDGEITNYTYTDLRPYLSIPFLVGAETYGIHLQELGHNQLTSVDSWTKKGSKRRVENYLHPKKLNLISPGDFHKPEHYFRMKWFQSPALIDIGVEDRYKNHWDHYMKVYKQREQGVNKI